MSLIGIGIIAGLVYFSGDTSSTNNKNLKDKITFKKALEEIEKLDKVEAGKGVIKVSAIKNSNVYFIKNDKKYNISYFSNNNKTGTKLPKNCIDKKEAFDVYLQKNNFNKNISNKQDLEKYISFIKHFCTTI